jgi:hypothetical protein
MSVRRWVLGLAVWAVLAAQMLGLLHRVVHSPLAVLVPHAAVADGHGHAHISPADALRKLFGGHGSTADCRVYDQVGHSDALPPLPILALPATVPAFVLQSFAGDFIARWAALFDARGPPVVR